ncbi:hypothetical protein VTN96DRAFT_7532 [Rasamsonia emersonii]
MANLKPPVRGPRKSMCHVGREEGTLAYGSWGSCWSRMSHTVRASESVGAVMEIVSRLLQAGTTPRADIVPLVGFRPTTPLNAAGIRPLPAVSVPKANDTKPAATATADPDDDPPAMWSLLYTHRGAPYGERQPERPVASWSMLSFPIYSAPASRSSCTANACDWAT